MNESHPPTLGPPSTNAEDGSKRSEASRECGGLAGEGHEATGLGEDAMTRWCHGGGRSKRARQGKAIITVVTGAKARRRIGCANHASERQKQDRG